MVNVIVVYGTTTVDAQNGENMIEREITEIVKYTTGEELKQDWIAHRVKYNTNLDVIQMPGPNDTLNATYHYFVREPQPQSAREQLLKSGPKQLPPHIQATYSLTLETEHVNELSKVMNNLSSYYPGMKLYSYGITQSAGEAATAMICLVNYDPTEDEDEEENEDEEDGDIKRN